MHAYVAIVPFWFWGFEKSFDISLKCNGVMMLMNAMHEVWKFENWDVIEL